MDEKQRAIVARRAARGAALPLLGAVLLGIAIGGLQACQKNSRTQEAVEELEDEARDVQDEIEDEVDDHT